MVKCVVLSTICRRYISYSSRHYGRWDYPAEFCEKKILPQRKKEKKNPARTCCAHFKVKNIYLKKILKKK
jgi:hypothetical protein